MAEQTSKPGRWPDILTALLLSMTVLVAGLYTLIWFDPTLPVNPFPLRFPVTGSLGPMVILDAILAVLR